MKQSTKLFKPIVTELSMSRVSHKRQCLFCNQPIGAEHAQSCGFIRKKVKIRMIVEYEVSVPHDWDRHMVELHRNDSGWCADSAIGELQAIADGKGCLCDVARFEYIKDTSEAFLDEAYHK